MAATASLPLKRRCSRGTAWMPSRWTVATAACGLSVPGRSSAPMYERHRDRTDDEPQDRRRAGGHAAILSVVRQLVLERFHARA